MSQNLHCKPLISIITVCYNAEKVIEKTMLSVLCQSYKNIEYVIVDGMSTDKTLEIIERTLKSYKNVPVKIVSENDNGIYDAMNKAISYSNGDWLNFMNAGDVFSGPTIISEIVSSGLMNTSSFIYSDFIANDGHKARLIPQSLEKGKILHQSSLYKKSLHYKYGLFYVTHPYIVSDYLFFLQIPQGEFVKYSTPISVNDISGISMQGFWLEYGRISADFMMRRISEGKFVFLVIKRFIYNIAKRMLRFVK